MELFLLILCLCNLTLGQIDDVNEAIPKEEDIAVNASATKSEICVSDMGKRCLPKSQLGPFENFAISGDPCFVYNNKRVSRTNISRFHVKILQFLPSSSANLT